MKIHKCEQNTKEWWELHRGIASASSFDRIITPKKRELSTSHRELIAELIAQRLLPNRSMIPATFISQAMTDGMAMEPEARRWYEFERNVEVEQVGFITTDDGRFGCSPDATIHAQNGGLELKCPLPKTHVSYLLAGILPPEYYCQVHGELFVTGFDWIDFVSYCPGMPRQFMIRVTPDDFTTALAERLEEFYKLYTEAMDKIKGAP